MTTKYSSICAVVLTLNEEAVLARALGSVQWCDEVLVLDSGSSDRTEQITRSFGAKFLQNIQPGEFLITEQRNFALRHPLIQSEWVLFLDADEEISSELALLLRSNVSNCSAETTGFELAPRYLFLGKWLKYTQSYPSWHPRIARKSIQSFKGGVWESFAFEKGIERIKLPYEHYAYSKGLDDWLNRHIRYAKWEAKRILKVKGTSSSRKRTLRYISDNFWTLRPLSGFINKYFLSLGFFDGWQGLLFSLMMSAYDLFVVLYIIEYKRTSKGKSL